ncbi:MAG: hypothetical protein Q9178_005925 [Gyalolechia marmorata]
MADTGPLQHPVDSLEPTLALVLKETGKFFRATQSNDSRQIGLARTAISQAIPAANLRFHDALDDIETEIIKAKSVFERDLSSIRTKRAERERAAAGLLGIHSPSRVVETTVTTASPKVAIATTPGSMGQAPNERPESTASDNVTDKQVKDEPDPTAVFKSSPEKVEGTSDTVETEPFSIPQSLPQDPNAPKGLAISLDHAVSVSASAGPAKIEPGITNAPSVVSMQINATPPNLSNTDFESMFEDSELPVANHEIDFDLAFPSDNARDTSGLMDASAFESLPMANTEGMGNANIETADEDLTTLLPGLENYVNDSNDFQLPDMPGSNLFDSNNNRSSKPDDNPSAMSKGEGNRQNGPTSNPPMIESNFDDMFGLDSYMNGTGDDELGGTGNMGEVGDFDEDWFKTDGM